MGNKEVPRALSLPPLVVSPSPSQHSSPLASLSSALVRAPIPRAALPSEISRAIDSPVFDMSGEHLPGGYEPRERSAAGRSPWRFLLCM